MNEPTTTEQQGQWPSARRRTIGATIAFVTVITLLGLLAWGLKNAQAGLSR